MSRILLVQQYLRGAKILLEEYLECTYNFTVSNEAFSSPLLDGTSLESVVVYDHAIRLARFQMSIVFCTTASLKANRVFFFYSYNYYTEASSFPFEGKTPFERPFFELKNYAQKLLHSL